MQVDQRRTKKNVLRRLQEHAAASATLTAAGVLRLWQRQPLALLIVAAWMGEGHQVAKILAWRAWSGYTRRRIRFKALLGLRSAASEVLTLGIVFAGWRAATRMEASATAAASCGPDAIACEGPRAYLEAHKYRRAAGSERGVATSALPWRHMPPLPPLWREPVSKRKILEAVAESERMSESLLSRKVAAILQVKVRLGMQNFVR